MSTESRNSPFSFLDEISAYLEQIKSFKDNLLKIYNIVFYQLSPEIKRSSYCSYEERENSFTDIDSEIDKRFKDLLN